MKKQLLILGFLAGVLALPASSQADGFFKPFKVQAGLNWYFRIVPAGTPNGPQLGPWYQYWPLEAHFQPSAPMANYSHNPYQALAPNFYNNQFRTVQPVPVSYPQHGHNPH